MIQLDGSYGEGGGSLTRVALALSSLTGKEFTVNNIRAGRPNPGLKAQHLHAIKALTQLCNAETNDVDIGSTELHFKPGKIKSGKYDIDIGTAGSITLLLQALILPSLFAPSKVTLHIKGGTCGKWQASVDYLQNVLLPHVAKFAEKIELKVLKRGYYPKGGGEVQVEISPKIKLNNFDTVQQFLEEIELKVPKIDLVTQGNLEQIKGIVNVSSELETKKVGERITQSTERELKKYEVPIQIRVDYAKTQSVGGELLLWALYSTNDSIDFDNPTRLGSSALIEKGKTSEEIGKEAARDLQKEIDSGASVDRNLADQLIMFMGILPGSQINVRDVSNHAKTNMYIVEKFLNIGYKVEGTTIQSQKDL
ncbi:RNA 3'-terminal phosphate cyclase [Candidatus Woesearchaeota archaeon]|jgi:RNA 3'-phosphate cyclase|nr:RNA 3'-terminal phosphate cyclase [Candidatus Woesearchaeota archaeon]MBT5396785.1 RNA 3'-terminal phosphate cyclase [Candidatus Woesearchaeota archaeon]MBT5924667.1 RNA 3'-terminal phosphate cyclase [Candidatus Woesearchaeota archaeon]MBT6367673.1 RNA 3'-terminal phosphate cyclase [Candidatus Woesearchaeota archaeon]MBT7762926.1 RNA 3'-terminal phosphate cyclase [Candidatus Woesearchaeota archaeon]